MKTLSWLGTLASIIGAFLVAFSALKVGYTCFIVGALCWVYVGRKNRDNALITLNSVFLLANFMGLYNAIK